MRIFNEDKTVEFKESEIDLNNGYLKDDFIIIEDSKKIIEKFIDEYNQPCLREYMSEPVYENIYIYILFTPEEKITNKIVELKSKLASTDYQAIKYAEGRMTGEEYAPIGEQRQAWRDEINQLEQENKNE